MPKKTYTILISSVLILVALFLFNTYRTKSIYSFINIDKITNITVQSGSTFDVIENIDEKAVIEYFKNVKFKKQFLQPPSTGWSYNVTFKTNSKEFEINFVSDTFVRINGKRYTLFNNNSYKLEDVLKNNLIDMGDYDEKSCVKTFSCFSHHSNGRLWRFKIS